MPASSDADQNSYARGDRALFQTPQHTRRQARRTIDQAPRTNPANHPEKVAPLMTDVL
jgi:hypothetical protein